MAKQKATRVEIRTDGASAWMSMYLYSKDRKELDIVRIELPYDGSFKLYSELHVEADHILRLLGWQRCQLWDRNDYCRFTKVIRTRVS